MHGVDLDQLAADTESLRALAKNLERTVRLVKQLAARVDDEINTLKSEEDTRK